MSQAKIIGTGLLFCLAIACESPAKAHQLWIEMAPAGAVGQEQTAQICWGHSGHRTGGEALAGQLERLTVLIGEPGSTPKPLTAALGADCFTAKVTPRTPGYYTLGADIQAGITDQEFHGIPPKTRIVMCGKTILHVAGNEHGFEAPLGMDLELVPVGDAKSLHPGGLATVRVLFKGKPIGGRRVEVSLNTIGNLPLPKNPRIEGLAWSVQDYADPHTGEVSFPLIVAGQHTFQLKYLDETPGTYDGDLKLTTKFSHLRKGDAYEKTTYMATLTVNVEAQ